MASFIELVYYVLLSVIALFTTILCFTKLKHKYKNLPPGPLALPIIGHLHLVKKPLYKTLDTLTAKYGPILYLKFGARPTLVISSPSAVEECFTKNDVIFANRAHSVSGDHLSHDYLAPGWLPYGHQWRDLRRVTTIQTYSTNSLDKSACIRKEELLYIMHALFENTKGESKPIDMKMFFTELAFNVIMQIIAGKRIFDDKMDNEEKKLLIRFLKENFSPAMTMTFGDFFPALRRVFFRGVDKKLANLRKVRETFDQDLIDECRGRTTIEKSTSRKSMIDDLLLLQESDPVQYSDAIIKGIITTTLTAGTDTTALTMEWAMALLVNNPEVLHKASSEIQRNVQQGKLLDESDLLKLPYLNSIINETLRLYPIAPFLLPHFSSEECTVGGYTVPLGTTLLTNAWAIQRDSKNWVDPEKFIPERFESGVARKDKFKFIPFSLGRRNCPGLGLAMRMMGVTLGTLIQCFEWEKIGNELVDMRENYVITMSKIEPLVVMCKPRPNMINILSHTS